MNQMPTPPSLPINDIPHFLDEVSKLFDEITGSWSPLLFKEKFRLSISSVWNTIKQTIGSIKIIFNNLDETIKFQAGLIGEQLSLKFEVLSDSWKRFKENGTVRFLRHLLSTINIILGSLAKVIDPAEALKEFKETMEKLIEPTE